MFKRLILVIVSILLLAYTCYAAQNFSAANKFKPKQVKKEIIIEPVQSKLPEYESLKYTIRWLGLPVGYITASIKGIRKINGRRAYYLEVIAKTNDFCSAIYKVDDKFVSYMDVETFSTLRHEVYRREGKYKKDAVTDFDHITRKAHFKNLLDESEKEFDIPEGTQDTLSACYYFRLLPVEVGKRIEYAVCNNEKNYKLLGVVESKGMIRVPKLGRRESLYIQPYAKLKGEKVKKGRVSGYFSVDSKRTPLLAIVQAPMFTEVTAALREVDYGQKS